MKKKTKQIQLLCLLCLYAGHDIKLRIINVNIEMQIKISFLRKNSLWAMEEYKRGWRPRGEEGLFGEGLLRPEEVECDHRQIV